MESGTYLSGRSIAESALGVLCEGTHTETKERVLIYRLPVLGSGEAAGRLRTLCETLHRCKPPGMLPLRELTTMADGSLALVVEFARGETLAGMWKQHRETPRELGIHVGK